MDKTKLFQMLNELYIDSVSDFDSEENFQNWASKVDPLIAKVDSHYCICFRAARGERDYDPESKTYKLKMEYMLEQFRNAYEKIKAEIDLEGIESDQEYYPQNSQYSIQKKMSSILNTANKSIWIYDAYMDEKIITELENVKAKEIKLLTNDDKSKLFFQRLEAFQKEHLNLTIAAKKSNQSHDRYYILDKNSAWNLGASFKDAGNKPTSLHEVKNENDISKLIADFDAWWGSATNFRQK